MAHHKNNQAAIGDEDGMLHHALVPLGSHQPMSDIVPFGGPTKSLLEEARLVVQTDELQRQRREDAEWHHHKQIWSKHFHGGPYYKVVSKTPSSSANNALLRPSVGSHGDYVPRPEDLLGYEVVELGPTTNFVGNHMTQGAIDLVQAQLEEAQATSDSDVEEGEDPNDPGDGGDQNKTTCLLLRPISSVSSSTSQSCLGPSQPVQKSPGLLPDPEDAHPIVTEPCLSTPSHTPSNSLASQGGARSSVLSREEVRLAKATASFQALMAKLKAQGKLGGTRTLGCGC